MKKVTYTVKVKNIETGATSVLASKADKETAEKLLETNKALFETTGLKMYAVRDMDTREKAIDRIIKRSVSEWIGGYENTLQDYMPEDEEYKYAKEILNHDTLFENIYQELIEYTKNNRDSHIRFAGKEFMEERIEHWLKKSGYGKE